MSAIILGASSGGHLDEILQLREITKQYSCVLFTEATDFQVDISGFQRIYLCPQINRRELLLPFKLMICIIAAIRTLVKERPRIIISTGVLATVPLCLFGKLAGAKIVFIESFAKVNTPTLTGKLMYRFADRFYVQWPSMLEIYPNAVFSGGIY